MKRTILALLCAAPVLAAASSALAWVPIDDGLPRWSGFPVSYKINQATIPGSIAGIGVARVDAGFASWGAPGCTAFAASNAGNTNASYSYQDGQNVIRWISSSWPAMLGDVNSVIGVTMPVWDQSFEIFDADIVFNDVGFNWNDSGSNGNVDTQAIATHEQGHFLGLDHTGANGATMQAFYPGGTGMRTLEQDDIDGVCALYPVGGTAASAAAGGGGDCNSCVNGASDPGGACNDEINACGSNQACIDLYDCLGTCSTQACADNCVAQHPNGADDLGALYDCWCTTCATECAQECGGSSGSTSASSTTGPSTSATSGNGATSTVATTGAGAGTTGGGVGGAGAAAGATSGSGEPDDPPSVKGNDPQSIGGCSVAASPAGVGAALLLTALGAGLARRRRRR